MDNKYDTDTVEKIKKIPIVFIVGFGRSGTTLLQELMNAHPNIIGPPEYSFIVYLYSRYGNKKQWTKADIAEFIEALYFRPLFSLWLINKNELTEKLNAIADKADYALICKMIFYQMLQGKENISLFCDKNPENSLFISTLLKVFPDAKFIHMVRDPRDNVNSQSRSFKKKNIYLIARRWMGYNTAIEKEKSKSPAKFYTVLYENLVTTTEATMKAICEFLGIPFSPSMIQHQFNDRLESLKENKFFERVKTIHKGLLNPVNTSNIGKWEKEMSPQSIAITERITGTLARTKYGYKIKERKETKEKVSAYQLLHSWLYYKAWELYTKFRYNNYNFNKVYYRQKIKSRPMGV